MVCSRQSTNKYSYLDKLSIRNNFMHCIIFLVFRTLCIIVCEIEGMISWPGMYYIYTSVFQLEMARFGLILSFELQLVLFS